MAKARLLYVMDPMCSWCWGFAPVAEALSRQAAADGVAFHLVAGGLRAGHGAALDPNTRGYILGHWQTVQQTTGQPFRFDDALPEGFVYDTEPACRALVAARSLDEESAWPLVRAIQRAFYAEGRDVTQAAVLADPRRPGMAKVEASDTKLVVGDQAQQLDEQQRQAFLGRYLERLKQHYPLQCNGKVLLRFPRLFIVARR